MPPSAPAGRAYSRRPAPFDLASSSSSSSDRELEDEGRPPSSIPAATTGAATRAEQASLHSTTLVVTPPSPLAGTHPQYLAGSYANSVPPVPPIPPSPGVAPTSASWTPLTPTMAMSPIRPTTAQPGTQQPLSAVPIASPDDHHGHRNVAHAVNLAVSDAQALALALQVAAAAANPNASTMSANTSSGGVGATTGGRTPPSSTTASSVAQQRISRSPSSLSGALALASSGQLPLGKPQPNDAQQSAVVGSRPWSMTPTAASIAPSIQPSTVTAARSSAIILPYSPSISAGDLGTKPGSIDNISASIPALPASSSLAASDAVIPPTPGISSATLDRASQAKSYLASRYSMIMADPGNYNPLTALRRRFSPNAPRYHALQPPAPSFPFGRRKRFSAWEVDNQELADLSTSDLPLPPPSPPGSSRLSGAATSIGSVHAGPGPGSSSTHGALDLGLFPIASSGIDTISSLRSASPHYHPSLPQPSHAPVTSPSILASVFRRGSDPGGAGVSGFLPHPSQLLRRDSSTSRVPSTSALSTSAPGGARSRTGSPKLGPPHSPPPPPLASGASGYGQPLDLGAPALLPPSSSVVAVVSDPDIHASATASSTASSTGDAYLGIDPASLYCGLDVPPVLIPTIRSTLANTLVVPPVFSAHVSEIDARALTLLDRIRTSELAANEIRMQVAALTTGKAPMVAFEPGVELAEAVQVWTGALGKTEEVLSWARDRVKKVEGVGEELVGLVEDLEWAVGGEYLQTIKRLEDSAQGRTASRRRRDDTMLETAYTLLSYLLAGLALILWAVLLVIRAVRRIAWIASLPVRLVWSNTSHFFAPSAPRSVANKDNDPSKPTAAAADNDNDGVGWVTRVVPSSLSTMAAAAAASEQVMYGSAGRVTEQIERFINPDEWKARIEQLFDAPSTARSPSVSMDPPSSVAMGSRGKGHRRSGSSTGSTSRGASGRVASVGGPAVSLGRPAPTRRKTQPGSSGSAGSPRAPPPTVIVTAAPQGGS